MARPPKAPDEKRTAQFKLRLTFAEQAVATAAAQSLGISVSDFARRRLCGYRLPATRADQQSTAALAHALNRIGVNLNQIARHANEGHGVAWDELRSLMARVEGLLDDIYDPGGDEAGPQL